MPTVRRLCEFLERFAPRELAESWDNVGLLVGDRVRPVGKVMTCLTIMPSVVSEAVEAGADLIVAHHPLPFRPLKRLTSDTPTGRMLLELIAAQIAVYSPHTAFDSAEQGINQRLAEGLRLREIAPLVPNEEGSGSGRYGHLARPMKLGKLIERVKRFLSVDVLQYVGDLARPVDLVAIGCGSAGEMLRHARKLGCDVMLLGETRFHTCLEAEADGIALVLPGHYASERFAVEGLAKVLAAGFPSLSIWPSRQERDPLGWV